MIVAGTFAALVPREASAYLDRFCHWPGTTPFSVPVYINFNNFAQFGYQPGDTIVNARWVWNSQGGTILTLTDGGSSTLENAVLGTILVNADRVKPDQPGAIASTAWSFNGAGECTKMDIIFHMNWAHCGELGQQGCTDMWRTALHELGHAIGLGHSDANPSVMHATGAGGIGGRFLYPDDYAALRCDGAGTPCNGHGYAGRTDAMLEYKYSTNGGSSFTDGTDPANGYTTMAPAVAYGYVSSTDRYVLARVTSGADDGQIYWTYGTGATTWPAWSAVSGAKSFTGVSLVRGSAYYIMAYPDDTATRTVQIRRSADGTAWSAATSAGITAPVRPAMARLPGTDDILMVYADDSYTLQFRRSLADGATWADCADAICENPGWCPIHVAFAPAIACESTSTCTIWWPDGTNERPHIRERRLTVTIGDATCVVNASGARLLPPQSSRWFATLHGDLSATWDATYDDWVLGFRERNASTSALTFWRNAGTALYDDYTSGGLVSNGALSSPGIVYTAGSPSPRVGIFFAW
ncbi:MAG: matrixin family metalloprotease [Deltaproteobacteria bacterium]|nr:matrixin family metalloprotease [Deltaproteobacteria bacterium]